MSVRFDAAAYSPDADYAALDPAARDVLDCWFGAPGSDEYGKDQKRWFKRSDAFDAMLRERFGASIEAALAHELNAWLATPLGSLALVIVLDQFTRNCHRRTARMYDGDAQAMSITRRMIEEGSDVLLPTVYHRAFAYIPFEHDETVEGQREGVRLYTLLEAQGLDPSYARSAVRHAQIVERFGRFPHRNALLGRPSSDEEIAFLREPGSSF
ncbi:Uncharacterized conserved protein, DUF924 family [Paraburkholderia steynii]|uniref:Uncharacterized conserved protein, DUF924 family n=1 Tax=Paraburkholderia steynii TaxID=1245441 RepID=A0A7Z7BMC6_9BURK|nr:DUF924 family protein [Paraburkholderia steynii]SDJ58419.1 Uncharacterized conserved protein, DUF924 family [Paraburkholderia steynii]